MSYTAQELKLKKAIDKAIADVSVLLTINQAKYEPYKSEIFKVLMARYLEKGIQIIEE